jgi:NTE family protein
VAIPGVMPPVYRGDEVLVDGAAINNLPVDLMQAHAPGLVIGSDVSADRLVLGRSGTRRINIFQILMHSGMVNSVTSAAEQRRLADVLLKPPLANVDLLHWQAFDRAIEAGYSYACSVLESMRDIPRLPAAADRPQRSSLAAELERRLGVRETGS